MTRRTKAPRQAVVDRFEGDTAVLEVDGQEERRPRPALAPGAREGDVVDLTTGQVDVEATAALKARVAAARASAQKRKPGGFDL